MAQIQAKWPKSGQNLGIGGHNKGIGVFWLDLDRYAWIRAIMLGFGLFGRIWVRIGPKGDKALRTGQKGIDVWMYLQTGRFPVFYRTSSPLGPLPKNKCFGYFLVSGPKGPMSCRTHG